MKKIGIIGSGISGLTAGIYLQDRGYDVTIFEKNGTPGGFVTGWNRKGSYIDGCLHWMIGTKDGTRLNKIWKYTGALDDIEIIHPNSFYSVKLGNQTLTLYKDIDKLINELYKHSENDDEKIKELVDAILYVGIYEVPSTTPYELSSPKEMMELIRMLTKVRKFTKISLEDYSKEFNSPIIKLMLTHGLIDKKFSVFYFIQTISNFCLGNASLPKGGSKNLSLRMEEKFKSLGGKVFYHSYVSRINIEGNKATSINVNGEDISFDYIIPACDIHYTINNLLPQSIKLTNYETLDDDKEKYPTYSFITASYKIKKDLKNHEIAEIIKTDTYMLINPEDHVSIRHYGYDDELISNGYTTVEIMMPTYEDTFEYLKGLSKDQYYNFKHKISEYYKDFLINYYNLEPDQIDSIDVCTPLTYERYMNSYKGSFMTYALTPGLRQNLCSALIQGIDNVILANQWLMIPGGTCVAVTMGKFAAQLVLNKDGKDYNIE